MAHSLSSNQGVIQEYISTLHELQRQKIITSDRRQYPARRDEATLTGLFFHLQFRNGGDGSFHSDKLAAI
jgi:hypothetical protein